MCNRRRPRSTDHWVLARLACILLLISGVTIAQMGEKGNDGGQFFTPRQVIKAMIQVINPKVDDTIYDPGCGTGGFLA